MQEGWTATTPTCQTVTLLAGESRIINFGNQLVVVDPENCCDTVEVTPFSFTGLDLSGRSFSVHNFKSPGSPITWIDITTDPAIPGTCMLQGGGLEVDNNSTPWGLPYYRVPSSGNLPTPTNGSNGLVEFNLGIDYTCNWQGDITFVIHHADGSDCYFTYYGWSTNPPVESDDIGTASEDGNIFTSQMNLKNKTSDGKELRWIAFEILGTVDQAVILAGSGEHMANTETVRGYQSLSRYLQGKQNCLFELAEPLQPGDSSGSFNIVIRQDAAVTDAPTVRYITFDENRNAVSTGTVTFTGKVLSAPAGVAAPKPSDFEILNYFPDPVKDNATVNFLIGSATSIRIELFTLLGEYVSTVFDGHRESGLHSLGFNTAGIPSGTYYLRMASSTATTTRQLRILK
jgi:hypothetical protein